MNPQNNLTLGRLGEEFAKDFLRQIGYRIIESNFHKRAGELDIVAIHRKTLVFIEVKCRTNDEYGNPEEAITPWKMRTLVRSAQYYKLRHPDTPDAMRIDVISIVLGPDEKPFSIKHFENVSGF